MATRPTLQHRKASRQILRSSSGKRKPRSSKFFKYGTPKRNGLIAEVYFRTDEYTLDKQDMIELDRLIKQYQVDLLMNKVHFTFEGHADYRHTEQYNKNLSNKRALSVKSYICYKIGKSVNFSWRVKPFGEEFAGRGNLTADRRVDIVSSYVTPKPNITQPPQTEKQTEWKRIGFWLDVFEGDILFYKKIRGNLVMRIDRDPRDWYAWYISASLPCAKIPIEGSSPGGAGRLRTDEQEFLFNPGLMDPRRDWKNKKIFVRLAGQTLWVKIEQALPRAPNKDYEPIKGLKSRDLVIKVPTDGLEPGWCTDFGGIESGKSIKPAPLSPLPPGRDWL